MPDDKKLMRRSLDKKFKGLSKLEEKPLQGWIKTIREAIGMTTSQLAKRMRITQPRIAKIEDNESNLKISTLEKAAEALNCKLVYILIPNEPLEEMVQKQAKKKAMTLLKKVNQNMELESQGIDPQEQLEDAVQDLLNGTLSRIWDEK
ncbi:MAG: mobile mystery protein A [Heliobacteriaceae bacterium]|jgi:predicted DNA-binding mobile mystery protein A|nr:mobile mystery protein A [Heliobacteriaceae bacterium]